MDGPRSAGELTRQINLQSLTESEDSQGQPTYTPSNGPTIHAKVIPEMSETIEVSGQKTRRTHWMIWIRYRDSFPYEQCTYRGKTLRFVGRPIDIEERHQWLFVKAIEDSANV